VADAADRRVGKDGESGLAGGRHDFRFCAAYANNMQSMSGKQGANALPVGFRLWSVRGKERHLRQIQYTRIALKKIVLAKQDPGGFRQRSGTQGLQVDQNNGNRAALEGDGW
jgi:hypothetical protein